MTATTDDNGAGEELELAEPAGPMYLVTDLRTAIVVPDAELEDSRLGLRLTLYVHEHEPFAFLLKPGHGSRFLGLVVEIERSVTEVLRMEAISQGIEERAASMLARRFARKRQARGAAHR